jgi:hypothetical protein
MAAFTAKLSSGGNFSVASGAYQFYFRTTFFTKLYAFAIVKPAFWAFHFLNSHIVLNWNKKDVGLQNTKPPNEY